MSKLLMLGTSHDMAKKMYNTCFIIQNDEGNLKKRMVKENE